MKKAFLVIAVLMFFAVPAVAEEKQKINTVKLPIPPQAVAGLDLKKCEAEKIQWYAVAETYRMQLIKLGWDCKPQGGGVACTVKEGSE